MNFSILCLCDASDHKASIISSHNWFLNQFVCLFLGWFHPFMSCSSVQNKIFHSKLQSINNLFYAERKLLENQHKKKSFFSPIIFLLLNTFTQYNFKMPTSEHFFFSIFFSHQTFSSRVLVREISFLNIFFDDNWLIWNANELVSRLFFFHRRRIRSAL